MLPLGALPGRCAQPSCTLVRDADLFFATLLLPMFFQIWVSWYGVAWCALDHSA